MLKGLDGSAVKYITALSPTAISAAASTAAHDLSNFTFGTVVVSTGSTGAAALVLNVQRSSASNGTFQPFGASVTAAVLGKSQVRSFAVNTSAVWHRVHYTATGGGSPAMSIVLIGSGGREAPIDQDSNTVTYGTIP